MLARSAVLCVVSLALIAVPASTALAEDPPPDTTTTTVPPDTTTTTLPPPDTTTTTLPPTDTTVPETTTTTTGPASDTTTTTTVPGDEPIDLSPLEFLIPVPQFASLSGSQRTVLQRLQDANDTFATRRFTLVTLAGQLAAARDVLKAARVREQAAVENEILGLLDAALEYDDVETQAISELVTSDSDPPARAVAQPQSVADVVDALAPRLVSERKSAKRARVQAQASVASLKALFADQTRVVTDALAERTDAESAVTGEFGSDAGWRAHADGITAELVAEQAGQPDPSPFATFDMPLPGAELASPFGVRVDPLGGGAGLHPGIDLAAASGSPIHAAAAGVVVKAGDCGGYGYCVVIDHGSSLATLYAHQSGLLSQVGDHVEAGDVIGLVGSTGKSTGPHLHFEVRVHGVPIDPVLALAA